MTRSAHTAGCSSRSGPTARSCSRVRRSPATAPPCRSRSTLAGQSQLRLVVTDGGDGDRVRPRRLGRGAIPLRSGQQSSDTDDHVTRRRDACSGSAMSSAYSGSATDTWRTARFHPGSLEWTVTLYHCPGIDCHTHPFVHTVGASGSFTVPDHGDNSYFEITLWATDNGGATATTTTSRQSSDVASDLDVRPRRDFSSCTEAPAARRRLPSRASSGRRRPCRRCHHRATRSFRPGPTEAPSSTTSRSVRATRR